MQVSNAVLSRQRVELCGNEYNNVRFESCQMVFDASGSTSLNNCVFTDCVWGFEGAAADTLLFLRALSVTPGGMGLVRQVLNEAIPNLNCPT